MCRLFAFVSPDQSTAGGELGPAGIESLLSLARLHGDGWGWAGVARPGQAPQVHSSAESAASDPAFGTALSTPVRSAMVHLRWATPGIPVSARNAHPFHVGDLAFEHNGSLKPLDDLRALLSPDLLAQLHGDTDSEMYFALIREQLALGFPLADAAVRVAARLREAFPFASLNAILLDAEQLVVVHASARSILSERDLSVISRHPHLPEEHNEDYFALRWTRTRDGVILIGSTGVAADDWRPLPAEAVTAIRLADGSSSMLELADVAVMQR
ncbi:class II glutamine amidotransferase [Microbacterium sp. NPDC058345]|uniref:class II glutamine amidotransferase n=1 Tax=Microbacterium sp. NPDC058345 TaxID=3346455 RepID=UPI003665D00C